MGGLADVEATRLAFVRLRGDGCDVSLFGHSVSIEARMDGFFSAWQFPCEKIVVLLKTRGGRGDPVPTRCPSLLFLACITR